MTRGLHGAVRTLGGADYSSRAAPKVPTKGHTTGTRARAPDRGCTCAKALTETHPGVRDWLSATRICMQSKLGTPSWPLFLHGYASWLIWPWVADDDAAARRLGWCCCGGAALRPNDRATGSYACRARFGGSRVATGCGKPVRRCGGGKSPATEGALSEDPHSGQVVRAERLGGRRRPAAGIRGRSRYQTDHRTGRAPPLSRRPGLRRVRPA